MPILTAQPTAKDPAASHHAASVRSGESVGIGRPAAPPPEVLLPSGGSDHRGGLPDDRAWATAAFQRRVASVHRQLAPVVSRAALADSYGREAAKRLVRSRAVGRRSVTALQVAYALRWLELDGSVSDALSWTDLLDTPTR
ncbi:MAG: hypothetical protein ACSLFN_07175 [Candidatus Limnocylindrales bacterium]